MWKTDGKAGTTTTKKKSKEEEEGEGEKENAIDFPQASEQEKSR
jgi:hypothetical protein